MKESRICIIGNYSGRLDEGMGNVAYNLHQTLQNDFEKLILLNVNDFFKLSFWKKLFSFKPNIIHFIPGPTMKTLFFVKICKIFTKSKTVVTATRPVLPNYFKSFSNFLKPDVLIAQSQKDFEFFSNIKYNTKFISNGVNVKKFCPVKKQKQNELRKKYGFNDDDFIILHIGPVNKARNQKSLLDIKNAKKLLVVSITNESNQTDIDFLAKQGVIVWKKYIKEIQEIYQLSDVYVFPGHEELNSIQIPLSILEAMSCNLAVISTKFGGLEKIIDESNGFFYFEKKDRLIQIVSEIQENKIDVNTREKVKGFSWENISHEIKIIYQSLIE